MTNKLPNWLTTPGTAPAVVTNQTVREIIAAPLSIYQRMVAAGVKIDSHESDLYVPSTEQTRQIIADYNKEVGNNHRLNASTFRNNQDGQPWIDIMFAYEPFWVAKCGRP